MYNKVQENLLKYNHKINFGKYEEVTKTENMLYNVGFKCKSILALYFWPFLYVRDICLPYGGALN